jgi:hypothetical protein
MLKNLKPGDRVLLKHTGASSWNAIVVAVDDDGFCVVTKFLKTKNEWTPPHFGNPIECDRSKRPPKKPKWLNKAIKDWKAAAERSRNPPF